MNQKDKNNFKSKLRKKAKEYQPYKQQNPIQQQIFQQNQQQAFSYMINNIIDDNSQVKFQNNFKRLDKYSDIDQIRQNFQGLQNINSEKFQKNQKDDFKFVIITSNSLDDIHKSIKYGIWTSPKDTNNLLKQLYQQKTDNPSLRIMMFFKVKNDSQFCGCAEIISDYIEEQQYNLWWERVEWKGLFNVKWHYIKNIQLKQVLPQGVIQTPLRYFESQKELNTQIGMQILNEFENQKYEFQNSIFKMFCVMDRREDELITMRQKIKMNKMK